MSTRDLAVQARALADQHATGSLPRRAWACVGVCLATATTINGARRTLAEIPVAEVQAEARLLFDQLVSEAGS